MCYVCERGPDCGWSACAGLGHAAAIILEQMSTKNNFIPERKIDWHPRLVDCSQTRIGSMKLTEPITKGSLEWPPDALFCACSDCEIFPSAPMPTSALLSIGDALSKFCRIADPDAAVLARYATVSETFGGGCNVETWMPFVVWQSDAIGMPVIAPLQAPILGLGMRSWHFRRTT